MEVFNICFNMRFISNFVLCSGMDGYTLYIQCSRLANRQTNKAETSVIVLSSITVLGMLQYASIPPGFD